MGHLRLHDEAVAVPGWSRQLPGHRIAARIFSGCPCQRVAVGSLRPARGGSAGIRLRWPGRGEGGTTWGRLRLALAGPMEPGLPGGIEAGAGATPGVTPGATHPSSSVTLRMTRVAPGAGDTAVVARSYQCPSEID